MLLAADHEPVDRAAVAFGVFRIVQVVLVMGRVFGFLDDKVHEAGAVHGAVEFAGQQQHGVAQLLAVKLLAVGAPIERVVGIHSGPFWVRV